MASRKPKAKPATRVKANRRPGLDEQRAQKTEHLRQMVELMTSGLYVRGRTTYDLAREWGLSDGYAEKLAAEASRIVTGAVQVDDGSRARLLTVLDQALAKAMTPGNENLRAVTEIGRLMAQIEGHEAPKKVEGVFSLASALASVEDDDGAD